MLVPGGSEWACENACDPASRSARLPRCSYGWPVQPPRPVRRDKMTEYLNYFDIKCMQSQQLTNEAKQIIPGGVQHNLAFNYPFPIAIEKAEGAYLWDADGNQYIDFLQAGGPTILGSNYAPVREKVIEMLQTCGASFGICSS